MIATRHDQQDKLSCLSCRVAIMHILLLMLECKSYAAHPQTDSNIRANHAKNQYFAYTFLVVRK